MNLLLTSRFARAFVGFVSRRDFTPFAVYRIVFGLLVLAYYGTRGWAF